MTGLWLAALLPTGIAALIHLAGPQTPATAKPAQQRALVFERYMVHPYAPTARSTISAQFRFVNRGPHAVRIQKIDRSCGCLNRGLSQRTFQPGESGHIALQVETANETPGHKQYYADVHYADMDVKDAQTQTVRLRFQVDLPERQVSVRPKALIFYQLGTEASTREIVVSDYRKRRLRILSTSSSSPLARVRTTGIDEQNQGERKLTLEVTVDGIVPPGKHEAVITIRTDDPDYRRLQVPLIIQGPETTSDHTQVDHTQVDDAQVDDAQVDDAQSDPAVVK
jgi:hypothetical protein